MCSHSCHDIHGCWLRPLSINLTGQPCEPVPDNMKQVELRVPWRTNLLCAWSSSIYSLHRLLSLPAWLFGCRSQSAPSLWMLSVCLAEIEKHKGNLFNKTIVSSCFQQNLSNSVTSLLCHQALKSSQLRSTSPSSSGSLCWYQGKWWSGFGRWPKKSGQHFAEGLSFHMQQPGSNMSHVVGRISKSWLIWTVYICTVVKT